MVRLCLWGVLFAFSFLACSTPKNKVVTVSAEKQLPRVLEVNWMTLDEVQAAMKKEPRKVLIDFYTSWCGWCKVMDRKTYSNPDVIKYINEKFYAVKFDAERKDTVMFLGKAYSFPIGNNANELALELLQGRLSYPSTVFLTEGFQSPTVVPGYLDVGKMEMVLKFLCKLPFNS
ncbi:MAG: DUF255 domain-containing protein [Flavipsychrobacter sp.]|nr:DUF255 domain-containing protein [Flavipsychrobacter sp.]